MANNFQEKVNFIWQIANDLLRGDFKPYEYSNVILPMVVLRRLDLILQPTKDKVIETKKQLVADVDADKLLKKISKVEFYNTSLFDLERLTQDPKNVYANFQAYLAGYSKNVQEIIENFKLVELVKTLNDRGLLLELINRVTNKNVDLDPRTVDSHEMGSIFEELLRKFSEMSNETAGEHYTPREVIELMVRLMFAEHADELKGEGLIRTIYDPACGTGGMLTIAKNFIREINPQIDLFLYGQELNPQTYAIAQSDLLMLTGVNNKKEVGHIAKGSSFGEDGFTSKKFNYMFSNPPYGVSWKKEEEFIRNEASRGANGRFEAGLPRTSDGSLLFLQHMVSKMEAPNAGGSRIAVVLNGSPLFTGDAGSGESNIRKWLIENDYLEAIIALPTELFYNTGIATYIWVVTNQKPTARQGKVQLINAVDFCQKVRKSLGNKRNEISPAQIENLTKLYQEFKDSEHVKIMANADFGYTKVVVERPLIENGQPVLDKQGQPKADTTLRDNEKIPLNQDIDEYFQNEVLPYVPDAWLDRSQDKIGYEINFNQYFYEYEQLRSSNEIKFEILKIEAESSVMLQEIFRP